MSKVLNQKELVDKANDLLVSVVTFIESDLTKFPPYSELMIPGKSSEHICSFMDETTRCMSHIQKVAASKAMLSWAVREIAATPSSAINVAGLSKTFNHLISRFADLEQALKSRYEHYQLTVTALRSVLSNNTQYNKAQGAGLGAQIAASAQEKKDLPGI